MKGKPDLISDREAAILLNVSRWTLGRWRKDNKPPQHYKVNARIFYDKKDILEFLERCKSSQ